jgi:hypothetical protein
VKALFDQERKYHRFQVTDVEYGSLTDSLAGVCIYCATLAEMADPDSRFVRCPDCGRKGVFGVEELLLQGFLTFTGE